MKIAVAAVIGALVGFGLGYLGKCSTGTCPIMSNPLITAVLGAIAGAILVASK